MSSSTTWVAGSPSASVTGTDIASTSMVRPSSRRMRISQGSGGPPGPPRRGRARLHQPPVVGMDQEGERAADQVLGAPGAEQLERPGVGEGDPTVAMGEQRDRAGLDQVAVAGFAGAQGLLGRLELGDVDADPVPDDRAVGLAGRGRERPEPVEAAAAHQDPAIAAERGEPVGRLLDRREPGGAIVRMDGVLEQRGVARHRRGIEAVAKLELRAVIGIADPAVGVADAPIDDARDVVDDAAQLGLALAQLLGLALELGDVGVHGDDAALGGPAAADPQPLAVGEPALDQLDRLLAALPRPLGDPGRLAADRLGDVALLGEPQDQLGKADAGPDRVGDRGVEVAIALVAEHEAVVRVPEHEAVRDALERLAQLGLGLLRPGFAIPQRTFDPARSSISACRRCCAAPARRSALELPHEVRSARRHRLPGARLAAGSPAGRGIRPLVPEACVAPS